MADEILGWNETWSLAVVFGVASVPWTYGFVAGLGLPLWPSFVAAATYYAAGGGPDGLVRGAVGNLAGILYAAATIAIVASVFDGSVVALSLVVGAFMFLASLHPLVRPKAFAPAGFFGYATLFGVNAGGTGVLLGGLAGETVAAAVAMLVGAGIGFATDRLATQFAPPTASVGPG